jgi:hypothetical protein
MTDSVANIRRARLDDATAIHLVSRRVCALCHPPGKPPAPALEDYSQVVSRHDVFVLTVD